MNVTGMNKIRETSETQATLYPIIAYDLEQTVHGTCFPFSFLCISFIVISKSKTVNFICIVNANQLTVTTLIMNVVSKLVIDAQCFFVVLQLQISDLILAALRAVHCSNFV
ncbi:hypothetical protein D917_06243 [Trichinella nativa]|uniref:Uncharacterized protein n=1 Tax=Trichinella nativa TaxID=6335 RepID=A0A1Y3ET21_9BILA|nr:hypothetical protein D917_06243 [Trichinella nativa]